MAEGAARPLVSNTHTAPLSNMSCCLLAVRRDVHDQHPGLSAAFTRAIRRAAVVIENDPAEAVQIAIDSGHLAENVDRELIAGLLDDYVWTATGRIEEDLERYFEILIAAGELPSDVSRRELVERVYRSGS